MHYLHHLWYLLRHKFHVFYAGLDRGVPLWQLVIHDLSKFRPSEFIPLSQHFDRNSPQWHKGSQAATHAAFESACSLHASRNPHHWEFWRDKGPMPERYVLEMLADWDGAGLTKHGRNDTLEYYQRHKNTIVLHPGTRAQVEVMLGATK